MVLCGPEDNASAEEQNICTALGYCYGRKSGPLNLALMTYSGWVFWTHPRLTIKLQFPIGYYFLSLQESSGKVHADSCCFPCMFSKEVASDLRWVQPVLSKSQSFP